MVAHTDKAESGERRAESPPLGAGLLTRPSGGAVGRPSHYEGGAVAWKPQWGRRLWRRLQDDWQGFFSALSRRRGVQPGMYAYRITPPGHPEPDGRMNGPAPRSGPRRSLHLRIEPDGEGTLFVDAMDVIHLNRTAAHLAKLALDGVPVATARSVIGNRYRDVSRRQAAREAETIYGMVEHLATFEGGCLTCALPELGRRPAFSTRARAPHKADLALTYGCNNSCSHCYNEPDRLDMPSLPKGDWIRILDSLAEVGVPHVIFTGGEATLHPDLPEIIRHADRLGQITGLNTNGRRIGSHGPKSGSSYMQTLADAGLNHVQITLASHIPQVHNAVNGAMAFHQTVQGIRNAVESGVYTITNTTLMRANVDHVEPLIEFLYDLGVRTFAMNGMIYSGGGFCDPNSIPEEEMAPLLLFIRDKSAELGMRFLWYTPTEYCRMSPVELEIGAKRCNAGEYSICVEPNGDVLPCQSYYVTAGNLLRDPWETIWQGELFRSFRNREEDPRWAGLPEKCWECPDLPMCGGGCRIEREARHGRRTADPLTPHPSPSGRGAGGEGSGCGGCGSGRASFHQTAGFVPLGNLIDSKSRSRGRGHRSRSASEGRLPIVSAVSPVGGCCSGAHHEPGGCRCSH